MATYDSDRKNSNFDIIVAGGTIVDGTGRPAYQADIGVKDDQIVTIGALSQTARAQSIIDAKDKIVTPGFIDIHTHIDVESNGSDILSDGYAENFIMQGTTTVIGGNCGMGSGLIHDFLKNVKAAKTSPNVGVLVGHGDVRKAVLNMDNRRPSASELEEMKRLVQQGMEAGAFGLSSGLGYAPGSYADLDEMVELCKVVARYNGFYTAHIREQSKDIINSWKEIVKTAELSGVRGHIAHVQIIGERFWGASTDLVAILKAARNRGIAISCDGYPYESGATTIVGALIPNWVQAEGKMKARLEAPELLPKIKKEIETLLDLRGGGKSVLITASARNRSIEKQYLEDIALNWKLSPVEAVVKIAKEFDDSWAIYFHSSEVDKEVFFSDPCCAVGSDSFCVLNDLLSNNLVHPRSYGTMPGFLAEYVKKKKTVSLEEGIRKMTSLPAEILGITDRGKIIEANKADLVVFDYEEISDNSSYIDAHHYPGGIDYVLVNGSVVVKKGVHQKTLPGVALYGSACAHAKK